MAAIAASFQVSCNTIWCGFQLVKGVQEMELKKSLTKIIMIIPIKKADRLTVQSTESY